MVRELPHVVRARGAEAIDGLRVVAHRGELRGRAHATHDVGLQGVGVLVLVDEDMVEHGTHGVA